MSGLLRIFGYGILASSFVAIIWFGGSAISSQSQDGNKGSIHKGTETHKSSSSLGPDPPPWFIPGDCIGEKPCGVIEVGPNECVLTCPVLDPLDPGECVYAGKRYELNWIQYINWENTGPWTRYTYLVADCTDISDDSCWFFPCPEELDPPIEYYEVYWYFDIEPDPECPR